MENTKTMGNAAEEATQHDAVMAYRNQMLELLNLLQQNDAALNKFADLYREDFGNLLKECVRVEEVRVISNEKGTDTWVDLRYKNRFYMLQEVLVMLQNFLREESKK